MSCPKGGKERPTPHHSVEQNLIIHRSSATCVKGLSAIALLCTHGIVIITTLTN